MKKNSLYCTGVILLVVQHNQSVEAGLPFSIICYTIQVRSIILVFMARRSSFHFLLWKGILHLVRMLKSEFPAAKQQCNAECGSTAGYFSGIRAQFERLQQQGPNYGYYPELSKSILVAAPHNVE